MPQIVWRGLQTKADEFWTRPTLTAGHTLLDARNWWKLVAKFMDGEPSKLLVFLLVS
jgi:hypothetical protein